MQSWQEQLSQYIEEKQKRVFRHREKVIRLRLGLSKKQMKRVLNSPDKIKVLWCVIDKVHTTHSMYFRKLTFGNLYRPAMLRTLLDPNMTEQQFINEYDEIYAELDGFVVRKIMSYNWVLL